MAAPTSATTCSSSRPSTSGRPVARRSVGQDLSHQSVQPRSPADPLRDHRRDSVLPGPCTCRSAHRRIADVQGRLDDVFIYQDLRVHPHLFRAALSREADVEETRCDRPQAAPRSRSAAPRRSARMGSATGSPPISPGRLRRPQVTVEVVDRFERPGGPAKLKRFLPLDQAPGRRRRPMSRSGAAAAPASAPGYVHAASGYDEELARLQLLQARSTAAPSPA